MTVNGGVSAVGMPQPALVDALRAGARYAWDQQAACELLIVHGEWLRRGEFRELVDVELDAEPHLAFPDWPGLAAMVQQRAAPSLELAVLRLACSFTGTVPDNAGAEWSLRTMLRPLDQVTGGMVIDALHRALTGSARIAGG